MNYNVSRAQLLLGLSFEDFHLQSRGVAVCCAMMRSLLLFLAAATLASAEVPLAFSFGNVTPRDATQQVLPDSQYSDAQGFGFDAGSQVTALPDGGCTSAAPFHFHVKLAPGSYRIQMELGDQAEATTTVKSEMRRLLWEQVVTQPKEVITREGIVHVRTAQISSTNSVRLKEREQKVEMSAWDNRLTLEFSGTRPAVRSLKITPVTVPVLYLLGDSTVCDQPSEPYASWGQMLPRWFSPSLAVANYAQSGESLRSSFSSRRLEKVVSQLKAGDFVLIQFGHNDEKDKSPGAGAFTTYADLLRQYAQAIQAKQGQPIFVTPVQRRTFDADGKIINSHHDFPAAMKQVAAEMKLPLIDLHALSTQLYEAMGREGSGALFKDGDGTHHNNFGAYELSRCVVEGLRNISLPDLSRHLLPGLPKFDPTHPDDPKQFSVPASIRTMAEKPLGN